MAPQPRKNAPPDPSPLMADDLAIHSSSFDNAPTDNHGLRLSSRGNPDSDDPAKDSEPSTSLTALSGRNDLSGGDPSGNDPPGDDDAEDPSIAAADSSHGPVAWLIGFVGKAGFSSRRFVSRSRRPGRRARAGMAHDYAARSQPAGLGTDSGRHGDRGNYSAGRKFSWRPERPSLGRYPHRALLLSGRRTVWQVSRRPLQHATGSPVRSLRTRGTQRLRPVVRTGVNYSAPLPGRTTTTNHYANRNSLVRNSLIASRSFAAFSNSNRFALSRMSLSSFAM